VGILAVASICAACGGGENAQNPEAVAAAPGTPATGAPASGTTGESPVARAAAAVDVPQYREVTLPAGTTLRLELQSAVASDSSSVEDTVRAALRQPVTVDGKAILPTGTAVVGTVTEVERAGRVKGRAHVAYRFNSLNVGGEQYDISTNTLSHLAPATKGEDATKIGIGAGAGAAIGALLGGGDGAAKGAAIGGAAGTGTVLATRGQEIRLGPGADVTARLSGPVTIRVKN
jgi:hypothetical protein